MRRGARRPPSVLVVVAWSYAGLLKNLAGMKMAISRDRSRFGGVEVNLLPVPAVFAFLFGKIRE
jgi:hypothetical protein